MGVEILSAVDSHGVEVDEASHRGGQRLRLRHFRAPDQDRNNPEFLLQGGFDLNANPVSMQRTVTALHIDPSRSDDRQHDIRFFQGVIDMRAKILAGRNIVDVHKDRTPAEAITEPVEYTAGNLFCVGPAVGNDNFRHGNPREDFAYISTCAQGAA